MRQVVLDTETTGLEFSEGHRIIEIGCVEICNRRLTDRRYHQFLNPERDIDAGAMEVHGISAEQLQDCPRFAAVAHEFLDFVRGAELVIHNAPFDVGFINAELQRLGPEWGRLEDCCTVFDTLVLARELNPGQRNSLDALCKRYQVDNSQRQLHGALLDAEILAEVYLAMTGGQALLALDEGDLAAAGGVQERCLNPERPPLLRVQPTAAEAQAHGRRLDAIDKASGGKCLWRRLERGEAVAAEGE